MESTSSAFSSFEEYKRISDLEKAGSLDPVERAQLREICARVNRVTPKYIIVSDGCVLGDSKDSSDGRFYNLVADRVVAFTLPESNVLVDKVEKIYKELNLTPLTWGQCKGFFKYLRNSSILVCHGAICYSSRADSGLFIPSITREDDRIKCKQQISVFAREYPEGSVFAGTPRE